MALYESQGFEINVTLSHLRSEKLCAKSFNNIIKALEIHIESYFFESNLFSTCSEQRGNMNPYAELGVSPAATLEELKRAYRRAVLLYHPDTSPGYGNTEKFNSILQAYRILKNKYEKSSREANIHRYQRTWQNQNCSRIFKVDNTTLKMPLYELAFCLETSENPYVKIIAIEAIALKRHPVALQYLKRIINTGDKFTIKNVLRSLGQSGFHQATSVLLSFIFSDHVDIAISAIQALERIHISNRNQIIQQFKQEDNNFWENMITPIVKQFNNFGIGKDTSNKLGEILCNYGKLSNDQLELSLLLQKRYRMLLGQILCKLEYLSPVEVQRALSIQQSKKN